MTKDKETRIADNIRLILKGSKTIKETQEKLKVNFLNDDWRIIDLYSIDDYIRRIFLLAQKKYCAKNKEKRKTYFKEYYKKYKKSIKEAQLRYYSKNRDKLLEYHKKYYLKKKQRLMVNQ